MKLKNFFLFILILISGYFIVCEVVINSLIERYCWAQGDRVPDVEKNTLVQPADHEKLKSSVPVYKAYFVTRMCEEKYKLPSPILDTVNTILP